MTPLCHVRYLLKECKWFLYTPILSPRHISIRMFPSTGYTGSWKRFKTSAHSALKVRLTDTFNRSPSSQHLSAWCQNHDTEWWAKSSVFSKAIYTKQHLLHVHFNRETSDSGECKLPNIRRNEVTATVIYEGLHVHVQKGWSDQIAALQRNQEYATFRAAANFMVEDWPMLWGRPMTICWLRPDLLTLGRCGEAAGA